jgi:hypothetical protein
MSTNSNDSSARVSCPSLLGGQSRLVRANLVTIYTTVLSNRDLNISHRSVHLCGGSTHNDNPHTSQTKCQATRRGAGDDKYHTWFFLGSNSHLSFSLSRSPLWRVLRKKLYLLVLAGRAVFQSWWSTSFHHPVLDSSPSYRENQAAALAENVRTICFATWKNSCRVG